VTAGGRDKDLTYALFKMMSRLRQHLDIKEKVELLFEKIRIYFYYWLESASIIMKQQLINDGKIILLFEGIDYFVNV